MKYDYQDMVSTDQTNPNPKITSHADAVIAIVRQENLRYRRAGEGAAQFGTIYFRIRVNTHGEKANLHNVL